MIDIYICEDNAEQRAFFTDLITDHCESQGLDAALALASSSPTEVLAHFEKGLHAALLFLDIDLKTEMNGLELGSRIRELTAAGRKVFIVFLTIHAEMSLLTFQYKVEALDFIIKGKSFEMNRKVRACIDTAIARHVGGGMVKTVQIRMDKKAILLDMGEIICVETTHVRHKLRLHTETRVLEFNGELKDIERQLDERFVRCHKSYIINREQITEIDKKENVVTMRNGSVCPVSRGGWHRI